MKTTLALSLTLCASIFIVSCKTSSPIAPGTNNGTPTAVGTPIGTPSTATIDAAGGSVMSPDGRLEVIIPAAALSTATPISIQPVTNTAPLGAGIGFSLSPDGQKFSQPVTLRFHYKPEDILGSDVNALAIATQKVDHIWYSFKTVSIDAVNGTVSTSTTHFSPYSLYQSLRISPMQATIKVNTSQKVTVQLVAPATDDDANDELSPLATIIPYPNAEEISWTLNGSRLGSTEDGTLDAVGNTSTATYNAPTTTADMSSNPVAVTAEVDILGPSKQYLISNIKVTSEAGVSGTISLTVNVNGSRTRNNGIVEVRSEEGSANLVYDIPNAPITEGSGSTRDANWDNAGFTGSSHQIKEYTQTYELICNGGVRKTFTDREKTEMTFSSSDSGKQITGVGLTITPDGAYTIMIGPPRSLTAASSITTTWRHSCELPEQVDSRTGSSPIPYAPYFIPYIAGGMKTTGTIDPANPNTIRGSYHGTDDVTMFSQGTETITMPIDYTISWDLTLTQ